MNSNIPTLLHDIEWRHARAWVGRRLVLRERWMSFEAGTPCRVMCVVDFGDGLLFWIRTDDTRQQDVDQVTRRELEIHFRVLDSGPRVGRSPSGRPALRLQTATAGRGERGGPPTRR